MIQETSTLPTHKSAEISSLIDTLNRTQKRLEELTAGEVDSVVDREGHAFFLRRAQEELRLSESARQAAILNALPAQVALLDGQGIIVSANESWRQSGIANLLQSPGVGVGQNYIEVCEHVFGDCSEEGKAAAKGIRQVLQGKEKEFALEYPCHSPTEKCWFHLAVTPVNSDHQAGAVVMHTDITKRKQSEESIRLSEERFRSMFTAAATGIAISTPHGRFLQTNAAYCRMLGYTEDELRELDFASLTHPDDLNLNLKLRNEVLAGLRESFVMEKRYLKKNGDTVWTRHSVSASRTATGEVEKFVVVAEDISERKLAEEQLRSKTAVLEAQVNSTLDGILVIDSGGNKILQNQRMVDLWRIPKEFADDPVDQRQLEWVTQQIKHPKEFVEKIDHLHSHPDEISRDELELVDGRFFDRYSSPVRGRDGTFYGRIWTMRDITERKQAAQQIEVLARRTERRERLLSTALASMSDFAQIYDQEGRILFVNQPLLDLWGLTSEEVVGKNLSDLGYSKELANKLNGQLQHVFETGQEVTDETPYTSPTGVTGFYEYIFSPALSTDGKVDFVVGSTRDVTLRKRAEVEIRFNEQRYRSLVEATTAIVWDTPASGQFTVEQPGWTAFTGQSFDELRGWGWLNAIHPDDREETERVWSAAIQSRLPYEVEHRIRTPDNSYRNMSVRAVPILDDDNTIRQWIGVHKDITQRKMAEERIKEQADLLDKTRDAIMVRDLESTILFWNKGAERMYGWTVAEAVGRKAIELLHVNPEKFHEANALVIQKGAWNGELKHFNSVGKELTVEARWTLVTDRAGTPKSVLAINTDITEKKQIEHQFLRAQRMESVGTLAGGVAHDLNNILAPILMSIQILKLTATDSETTGILQTIETSAKRGADIVRQVLSFARGVESQRIEDQPTHLLGDLESIIKGTFPKNIQVEISIPQEIWTIEGDPTQIHQVLLNLSVNARHAMPDGGILAISVENCVLDEHYSAMNLQAKPGRYVLINVTDSGSGMPQRIIEKIFEPFFTTKELSKGTGLGLSTVMAIIKSHEGLINVYSELGRGTTFKIYLPAMDNSSNTSAVEDISLLPRGNGQTVLVIDDEASILTVTGQTLRAFGYKSLTAVDGAEGVAMYAQNANEIAVVVTDMNMPIMNGMTTIRALQRMNPMLQIVAASGLNVNGDAEKLAEMGVTLLLTKPYTAETLLTALHQVLRSAAVSDGTNTSKIS
jgi:PAS domain S-box-containing protein